MRIVSDSAYVSKTDSDRDGLPVRITGNAIRVNFIITVRLFGYPLPMPLHRLLTLNTQSPFSEPRSGRFQRNADRGCNRLC